MATDPLNFYTFRTNGNKIMTIKPEGCCLTLTILGGFLGKAGGKYSCIRCT